MSFSLSQIQRKKSVNTNNIRYCFSVVSKMSILTKNVKYALGKYIDSRCKNRFTKDLTPDIIKEMIIELLEKCCNKNYINIGIKDVAVNENEILYQIKKAIYYGATKHLYFNESSTLNISNLRTSVLPPVKPERKLNEDEVQDYFKELIDL